jgi:hypothetical protein
MRQEDEHYVIARRGLDDPGGVRERAPGGSAEIVGSWQSGSSGSRESIGRPLRERALREGGFGCRIADLVGRRNCARSVSGGRHARAT